ncbi:unnamed protein product, partial [Coregonus sp. 'balchen']
MEDQGEWAPVLSLTGVPRYTERLIERLHELEIAFPPSYPYSEDSSQGKQYMNTRCPAWCDRVLMSATAKDLVLKPENEEKNLVYDNIGPNVCMGDHKPVYLSFRLTPGAGKWCQRVEKIS